MLLMLVCLCKCLSIGRRVLKLAGLVDSGVDAKIQIQEGFVKVNGEVEVQRGKKIHPGDIIEFKGQQVKVKDDN